MRFRASRDFVFFRCSNKRLYILKTILIVDVRVVFKISMNKQKDFKNSIKYSICDHSSWSSNKYSTFHSTQNSIISTRRSCALMSIWHVEFHRDATSWNNFNERARLIFFCSLIDKVNIFCKFRFFARLTRWSLKKFFFRVSFALI
jgi:hypothetical protein